MNFTPIKYQSGVLRLLDQRRLPGKEIWIETRDFRAAIRAIQSLAVRGAPLIGAAGGYALCLAAREFMAKNPKTAREKIAVAAAKIAEARPTAVNLAWAVARVHKILADGDPGQPPAQIIRALENEAARIESEDREACARIGRFGAALLCRIAKRPLRLLTHCNAGALATCGIGTALGVVRVLHRRGKLERLFADETRPLLQGARLTAWEMLRDNIPVTVQADGMAASLMALGRIDAVIVGADRIAANGDAANKIGTLPLALAAKHFGVPFYVAAPMSTVDRRCKTGRAIPIEQRAAGEIAAAKGAEIFNPAFDVTPAALITAFITERGTASPKKFAATFFPD